MGKSVLFYIAICWFTLCANTLSAQFVSEHYAGLTTRECVIKCARSYIGVVEATGNNDGEVIENTFLKPMGFNPGTPYCAIFTSTIYRMCDVKNNPESAWSPDWANPSKFRVYTQGQIHNLSKVRPGDAVTFWRSRKGRIGHVGLIQQIYKNYMYTIEGNTSDMGDVGRDGIWGRVRPVTSAYIITDYIQDQR